MAPTVKQAQIISSSISDTTINLELSIHITSDNGDTHIYEDTVSIPLDDPSWELITKKDIQDGIKASLRNKVY